MIEVQVRAQHIVHALARITGLCQMLEERTVEAGEKLVISLFVIADAGIDQNPFAARLYDKGLEMQNDIAFFVREIRAKPFLAIADRLLVRLDEKCGVGSERRKFENARDLGFADSPAFEVQARLI
jgi:hypothetical protein